MYTVTDYKTKKALKADVKDGLRVKVFQPGPFPGKSDGVVALEGPHYPQPHTWYAEAVIEDLVIVNIK